MKRRTYLRGAVAAVAAGALAGCTGSNGKGGGTENEDGTVFENSNAFSDLRYEDGELAVQLDKVPYVEREWQPITKITVASDSGDIVLGPKEFTYGDRIYRFDIPNEQRIYRVIALYDESEGDWQGKSNALDVLRVEISDGRVRILSRQAYAGDDTA